MGDITVTRSNDSISLSWSPPFYLDVTGEDPDVWYTVLISNVTDEDNATAIPCTDCHNLTQSHYTFTTDNPSPCHNYSFTVIPQNGAGNGSSSEPVYGHFLGSKWEMCTCTCMTELEKSGQIMQSLDSCFASHQQGICLTDWPDCVVRVWLIYIHYTLK